MRDTLEPQQRVCQRPVSQLAASVSHLCIIVGCGRRYHAALTHLKHGSWYLDVHLATGQVTWPLFNSLQCFWPGMQTLLGEHSIAWHSMAWHGMA